MLNVTRREMTRAYRELWRAARCLAEHDEDGRPRWLVQVYAVECGIKAALMKERRVNTFAELGEDDHIGHDLRKGLNLLNAYNRWKDLLGPREHDPQGSTYRTRQQAPQTVTWTRMHEAFRYGIEIEDEARIVQGLEDILVWLQDRLSL